MHNVSFILVVMTRWNIKGLLSSGIQIIKIHIYIIFVILSYHRILHTRLYIHFSIVLNSLEFLMTLTLSLVSRNSYPENINTPNFTSLPDIYILPMTLLNIILNPLLPISYVCMYVSIVTY